MDFTLATYQFGNETQSKVTLTGEFNRIRSSDVVLISLYLFITSSNRQVMRMMDLISS